MSENTRPRDGAKTKKEIMEAAMKLFSLHGYKGASVRKIAAEVGIRESALYNHFTNKEEIFYAVVSTLFSVEFIKADSPERIQELASSGKKFLSRYISEYKLATFDKRNESLFRILIIELLQNQELRSRFMREYHDKNVKILSQGFFAMMQEGLVRSGDPMLMANEFIAPLFYLRLQVTLLRLDNLSTNALATQFEKHVEFFWESICIS